MKGRDICKKIIDQSNCNGIRCQDCPIWRKPEYLHNGIYDCIEPAKKWLKDNPENPLGHLPKFAELQSVYYTEMIYGVPVHKKIKAICIKPDKRILCLNGKELCLFEKEELSVSLSTVRMEIPLDKVRAVQDLLK